MRSTTIATLVAAALIVLPISSSWSQDLPAGVTVQVVAEHAVDLPGIEKVVLRKITLEPGSALTVPVENPTFCDATDGVLTVTDDADGSTTVYTPGSRWAPAVGHTFTITNQGTDTHSHYAYAVIPAG